MLELGKKRTLIVKKTKEIGVFLGEEEGREEVLLPGRQVPEGTQVGDELEVFLYKDSRDRLIATTATPFAEVGEVALMTVVECSQIGAFLNWGLEKDLFLPFREQTYPVKKGDQVLAAVYVDRTERLCATMRISDSLSGESPYREGDRVNGTIYRINPKYGAFVAVDNRYYGMIPTRDVTEEHRVGTAVTADVLRVRRDGKLNLVPVAVAAAEAPAEDAGGAEPAAPETPDAAESPAEPEASEASEVSEA